MKKLLISCLFLAVALIATSAFAADWKPPFALQLYTYRMMPFDEAVKTAAEQGFKYVEIYPGHKMTKGSDMTTKACSDPVVLEKMKKILADAKVQAVAYGVTSAKDEAQWREMFAFVKALGIGIVQIEAGRNTDSFPLIDRLAGEYGIKIALHNHTQKAGFPENVLVELNGYKNIGSGADTGHWAVAGVVPVEGVKKLAGRFNAMHLVDEQTIGQKSHIVPYGQGACQIGKILEELKKQGFNGPVSLEYECVSDNLVNEVGECLKWYNAYFEK